MTDAAYSDALALPRVARPATPRRRMVILSIMYLMVAALVIALAVERRGDYLHTLPLVFMLRAVLAFNFVAFVVLVLLTRVWRMSGRWTTAAVLLFLGIGTVVVFWAEKVSPCSRVVQCHRSDVGTALPTSWIVGAASVLVLLIAATFLSRGRVRRTLAFTLVAFAIPVAVIFPVVRTTRLEGPGIICIQRTATAVPECHRVN